MSPALLRGASYIVASELLLATMSAVIKLLSSELPNEMLVFFRNLFGLAVLLPLIARRGWGSLRTRNLRFHLLRAGAGVTAMYCFFYTLGNLPLAEAVLFKLTAPFFIPLIAFIWLHERVGSGTRWAVLIGFIGAAVILRPGFGEASAVALIGLAGAALAALAKVAIRRMAGEEPSTRIVFYFGVFATGISALPLLSSWQTPSPTHLAWLLLLGLCATGAQLLLTRAYGLAPAGQIGPFTYVSVVFASLIGWLFWGEILDLPTLLGTVLIIGAGILTTRRPRSGAVSKGQS